MDDLGREVLRCTAECRSLVGLARAQSCTFFCHPVRHGRGTVAVRSAGSGTGELLGQTEVGQHDMSVRGNKDVLRLQITMNQVSFIEKTQRIQQLLRKDANQGCTQSSELILFDQFVQVDAEEFECQAEMLSVDEGILESQEVVVIVLVIFTIEL